jgi:large subunit ribosomal protein L10
MANAEKVAAVAELKERFETSSGAVLANYRGLTVAQLAELRRALNEHASFAVVKNTLTKIAATEAGVADQLGGLLTGPSAIAFVKGDVVEAAKGLRDFAKAHPALEIKGGIIDGKSMTPSEINRLADLESRDVLLAMLAGAMKASMARAAATMAALPTQMARLAAALEAKRAAEAPAGAPEPAAEDATAAPAAEDAAAPAAEDAAAPAAEDAAAPAAEDAAAPTAEDAAAPAAEDAAAPAADGTDDSNPNEDAAADAAAQATTEDATED